MAGHLCAEGWGAKESDLGEHLACGKSRPGGLCPRGKAGLGTSQDYCHGTNIFSQGRCGNMCTVSWQSLTARPMRTEPLSGWLLRVTAEYTAIISHCAAKTLR